MEIVTEADALHFINCCLIICFKWIKLLWLTNFLFEKMN